MKTLTAKANDNERATNNYVSRERESDSMRQKNTTAEGDEATAAGMGAVLERNQR